MDHIPRKPTRKLCPDTLFLAPRQILAKAEGAGATIPP